MLKLTSYESAYQTYLSKIKEISSYISKMTITLSNKYFHRFWLFPIHWQFHIYMYTYIYMYMYIYAQYVLLITKPHYPLLFPSLSFFFMSTSTLLLCFSDSLSLTGVACMIVGMLLFMKAWQICHQWLYHRDKMTFPSLAAIKGQYNNSLARSEASWVPKNENYLNS